MNGVRAFPQQVGENACCVIHHYEGLEKNLLLKYFLHIPYYISGSERKLD